MTAPDDTSAAYRAAVVRFAEELTVSGRRQRPPQGGSGTVEEPGPLLAAADLALVVYPGPVGELVRREIHAYLEIGHRFGGNALIASLIDHLTPDRRSPTMDEYGIESLARESIAAFNRSDWSFVADSCAEPFLYEETGTGTRLASVAEMVAGLQAWKTAIPDGTGEVVRAVVAGDTVVLEVVWRGTQTGPMATPAGVLPPSGRSFETWATIWARFRDGKLVQERHHMDMLTLLAQLGALPAPASA